MKSAGGTAPGYGYSLIFAGAMRPTPVMDNPCNIYAVTFDSTAGSFFVGGNGGALTLTGGVTNNSPNSQTLGVPVVLGAPVTFNAATASLTLSQNITNGGNLLTIADGGSLDFPLPLFSPLNFEQSRNRWSKTAGDNRKQMR